jgi:hypothetical protein
LTRAAGRRYGDGEGSALDEADVRDVLFAGETGVGAVGSGIADFKSVEILAGGCIDWGGAVRKAGPDPRYITM